MYKVCKSKLVMESNCICNGNGNGNGDYFVSSSSSRDIDHKVETVDDLLEECWFFENLLKRRTTMMLRCNSDPCPSTSSSLKLSQDLLPQNSDSEIENTSTTEKKGDGVVHRGLILAPSLPPGIGRKEEKEEKESSNGTKKLTRQASHQNILQAPKLSCKEKKDTSYNKEKESERSKLYGQSSHRRLQRAPSLPPNIGREDISQDKDDARMSKLIQQAFANSSESLYPQHTSKRMIQSYSSIPRARPPRISEVESNNTNGIREMSRRYLNQQKMIKKSLNDLEIEEVQGFKDLGFTFEKKDLSPSVVNILPGLQEKKREELNQDNIKMRRPYLSEAWLVQSCAPPVLNWVPKNSAEDMKAQLKFWARAVASNVH